MTLHGRTIMVTGGSQGLGEAACRVLAAAGARVIVTCSRNVEGARRVARDVGGDAKVFDVSDPAAVARAFAEVAAETGGVDVLVNNARCDPYARGADVPDGDWFDRVVGVNLKGPYLCSLAAMEQMKARGGGRLVHLSSVWAYRAADRRMLEYALSKAALHSLSRSLARLGAPFGVTSNVVAPGMVLSAEMHDRLSPEELADKTARIPVGRGARPDEIAAAIRFVVETPYMTGEIVNINGGTDMP